MFAAHVGLRRASNKENMTGFHRAMMATKGEITEGRDPEKWPPAPALDIARVKIDMAAPGNRSSYKAQLRSGGRASAFAGHRAS